MDVLSQVLKLVNLQGAVFFNAEFSAPWSFLSPPSRTIAPYLGHRVGHVIIYHLVTEGTAWAQVGSGPRVQLRPGDIVTFPHGDPHLMGNGPPTEPVDNGKQVERILSQGLEVARMGGGGELTKFVCGYMCCEPQLCQILLAGLPPMLTVNIRNDAPGAWLEHSIRFSVAHAVSAGAGAEAVLAKLSEALFTETLRRYVAKLPAEETSWLAGARDPDVGKALCALHRDPARPWTISDLAACVGVSRAVLAERFRHFIGEPPMSYLARWRIQLGARLLTTTYESVAEIAARVGYESESAFNRAFKRELNVPPAQFRKRVKSNANRSTGIGPSQLEPRALG